MPTKLYTWKRKSKSEYTKDINEYNALTAEQKALTKQPTTLKQQYLTSREVKAFIMKQNNWTKEQYQKQYDIIKNKLKAYESYKEAQGVKVERQSTQALLFHEARAKQLYGANYKPSTKMQQVKSFSAYSITKGRKLASQQSYQEKQGKKYSSYINTRFGGLLDANKGAQAIKEAFIAKAEQEGTAVNYAKMEEALSAYANKLGGKFENEKGEAIPANSEVYGSGEQIDFDIDDYL